MLPVPEFRLTLTIGPRALILLHELGHLILSEDGDWLIPDDGYNGVESTANTLRVQEVGRKELDPLK